MKQFEGFTKSRERTTEEQVVYLLFFFVVIFLLLGLGGCAMTNPYAERGSIAIAADEKGMRAFSDMINMSITNGKASPDKDTAAWNARRQQEREETKRVTAPSFLDGLFGSRSPVPESKQPVTEPVENVEITQGA